MPFSVSESQIPIGPIQGVLLCHNFWQIQIKHGAVLNLAMSARDTFLHPCCLMLQMNLFSHSFIA